MKVERGLGAGILRRQPSSGHLAKICSGASARLLFSAALCVVAVSPVSSQDDALFARLAGNWAGSGSVTVLNSVSEPVRCRGSFASPGSARLRLVIACASDSFKLRISSDLIRRGGRLTGTWHEDTFNTSGGVSGTIGADRVDALVTGGSFRAQLGLRLRGATQVVTLASQGQIAGSATVALRRE